MELKIKDRISNMGKWCANALLFVLLCSACSVSYKFNGASIDYETTKTIQIDNFPLRSAYVWAPMQSIFQNKLTDLYSTQTKLKLVKKNGDLQLAGEITGFDQYNKGISSDGYSSQVQLKMTVNVRFVNNNSPPPRSTTPASSLPAYRKTLSHKWSRTLQTRYSTQLWPTGSPQSKTMQT